MSAINSVLRVSGLQPSKNVLNTLVPPIPLARKWAGMYKPTPSRPLLNLSQGVPGSAPPSILIDSFKRTAATEECYEYGSVAGDAGLRNALAEEMKGVYKGSVKVDVDVTGEDVMITTGCNIAFVAAVMSLAEKGDEVILPVPWYFNHHMTLTLLGVEPVPLETLPENGFQPSVEDCAKLVTPRTKAIALVTPNNPTGAIYPPELISAFFDLANKHNIALILDETYRDFIIPGPPHTLFSSPKWRENLVHLFSFSKSYHIPGLRMGAIVVDPLHQESLTKILDTLQICAPTPPQTALVPVMNQMRAHINNQASQLEEKHKIFKERLPKTWKIAAQGGFYAYVRHPFPGISAEELCRRLAVELGIVTLPGGFFGAKPGEGDRWIRVAVANVSKEDIVQCCERLKDCGEALGWQVHVSS